MGWLNFGLPLEEELAIEANVRDIRACNDLDQLHWIAEQSYRSWCRQVDITSQLISQVAELEGRLGFMEEPDAKYLEWAKELSQGAFPHSSRQ